MAVPDSTAIRIREDLREEVVAVPEVAAVEMPTGDFLRYQEVAASRERKLIVLAQVVIARDRDGA